MRKISEVFESLKDDADTRFNEFEIENIGSITRIVEDAYLEKPTWLGGDNEFVCLYIDLNKSSKISFRKEPKTMAKIYDYFTQSAVDVLNIKGMSADYVDIKGDGVFGIYEGDGAAFKALVAAVTFKTFFSDVIKPKFQTVDQSFNCKMSITKDKVLVKKIGIRGDNNEVWAGRLVNNASKLASLNNKIYSTVFAKLSESDKPTILVVSDNVKQVFETRSNFACMSCGHKERDGKTFWYGKKVSLWKPFDISADDETFGNRTWYLANKWCKDCCDNYVNGLLE